MFKKECFVPWSGKRYIVNECGEIFDNYKNILNKTIINNTVYVELEWVLGKRKYPLGIVLLYCFEKLKLPVHLMDQVELLYIDKNWNNISLNNIIYRYKNGPIEVDTYPGFYYIPFFNDYALNKNGTLINNITGKTKVWSVTKKDILRNSVGGYNYTRCINDSNKSKILFRHRAMLLVFKKYDNDVNSIVVNHIDGNPSNNDLSNLEWSTYSKNNKHAYDLGLRPNASRRVLVKDLKTNEIKSFESVNSCSSYFGYKTSSLIYYRIKDNPNKVYNDLKIFKYDDGKPWPQIDLKNTKIYTVGKGEDIVARNVFTGDLIIFTGILNGGRLLNINPASILSHLKHNKKIPYMGYNFKYLKDKSEWPVHSEEQLNIYKKYPKYPPNGIISTDIKNNKELFFCSVLEASEYFKINCKKINFLIRTKKLLNETYGFKYIKVNKRLSPDN